MGDLVLWSGGCDSTLILADLAEDSSKKRPVRAISVECDQVGGAREQARARKRILKELRKRGHYITHGVIRVETKEGFGLNHYGQPQVTLWMCAIQALEQKEDLHAGFLKGEDFGNVWTHYQSAFDNLQNASGRTGKLILPLLYTRKTEVIRRLQKLKLYGLCWYCDPGSKGRIKSKPCGMCESCKTHRTALWQLKTFTPKLAEATTSGR